MSSSNPIQPSMGELSNLALAKEVMNQDELLSYLRALPYGRNASRADFALVLTEQMGTCSSKHALFSSIAIEQQWVGIELVLLMYKMNKENTPLIGDVIIEAGLEYIPEAHCVLRIAGVEVDITGPDSNFDRLRTSVLDQQIIEPAQVGTWKVEFHKNFLRNWISEEKIGMDFEELWAIREKCIERLSKMEI